MPRVFLFHKMKKQIHSYEVYAIIFCTALVVGNVVSSKRVPTGLNLFGDNVTVSAGIFCYMVTYLTSDVITELYGRGKAIKVVLLGLISQLSATLLILVSGKLDYIDNAFQEAYELVLGQNYVTVIATYIAYIISQTIEILIFYKIRDYFIDKYHDNKHRWIWNNASSAVSNLIDSLLISAIINLVHSNFTITMVLVLRVLRLVIEQYLYKMFISLLDTPFFYFLTSKKEVNQNG